MASITDKICINNSLHDTSKRFYTTERLCGPCYDLYRLNVRFNIQKAHGMHCIFNASHIFTEKNPLKTNPLNKDPSKVEMLCLACYRKTINDRSKMAMNNDKDLAIPAKRKKVEEATFSKSLEDLDNFFHEMPIASEESWSKPSAKRKPIHQSEYSKSLKKDIALPPNFSLSLAETPKSSQRQGLDQRISFYFDESKPITAAVKNDTNFVCVNDPSHNTTKYFNRTRSLCGNCNDLFLRKARFDRQKENGLSCAFDASHKYNEKIPLVPNPLNLDKRNVELICNLCYQKIMYIKSKGKLSRSNVVEPLPQRNTIDEVIPSKSAKEADDFNYSLLDFDIPPFPEEALVEPASNIQIISEDIPSELVNQIDSPDLLFPDLDIPLSPGFLQFMTEALKSSEPQSLDQPITAPLDNFDPMTTPLKNRSISVCINDPSHDISKGFYSGSSLCKSCYNKTLSRKKFDRQIELGLHCALDASHFFSAKSPLKSNPINSDPSTVEMLCNMCYLRIVRNKSMHQPNTDTSLESTAKTAKGNQEATSADQADSSHFSTIDFALPTTPSFPFFNPDSPEFDLTKW